VIGRRLEFSEFCLQLEKEGKSDEVTELTRQELTATFTTRGWQVVLMLMRQVVDDALGAIGHDDRPAFHAGQIHAIELMRNKLRGLFSGAEEYIDEFDEGLTPLEESEI
jgi:hypothetical protein